MFFSWITSLSDEQEYWKQSFEKLQNNYINFSRDEDYSKCLIDEYDNGCYILNSEKLTSTERKIIESLQSLKCWQDKTIYMGISNIANAWTDGMSYIAIDKDFINKKHLDNRYCLYEILTVMAHEMAHDVDTSNTHCHNEEFYRNFYEIVKGYNSPIFYLDMLERKLHRSKIEIKKEKEKEKREKKEAKIKKKLGITT